MAETEKVKVIGIGASAGGLEPLQVLLSNLPKDLKSASLIVAQHLSPDYKSMLVELLGRKTQIPVKPVESGMSVEKNTIYIAPANADVTIQDNKFHLRKPINIGAHPSVDVLFASIAKNYGKNSVGIVLSGTGKDGTRGVMAIKKEGGVTVAQEPESARYDGMPKSAITTGAIDHVLEPEKIGADFNEIISSSIKQNDAIKDYVHIDTDDVYLQIFDLLERRVGIDFTDYKVTTFSRRLSKRIAEKKFDSEQEYLEYIRKNPEELDKLFEVLLIGVTSFYRDIRTFEKSSKTIEKIISDKKSAQTFRMWIPGCATGEEAYTYAIIVKEILDRIHKNISVQIFATDIDIRALHKARIGIYPAESVQTVPKDILKKYFTKISESAYEVSKEIRKMVLYSRHDVTSNPPFLRLDLISCRNLLIYFNTDLQKRVFPLFYYALNPKGFLILGKSENIGEFNNLFATVDAHLKIFERKAGDTANFKFPHFRPQKTRKIEKPEQVSASENMSVSEMVKETIYENFEYPYVVIDETMDVVEVSGDVSKYLKFKQGPTTLNLMKLIIHQLQIEARSIIGKVINSSKSEKGNIRKVGGSDSQFVQLSVKPLLYSRTNNPYYVVIFEEVQIDTKLFKAGDNEIFEKEGSRLIELEQELDATKEHMNSLVEELETSNEELQALNEEMQASNEELQATNEELETSNEELQATNEELENAYNELREANIQIASQKEDIEKSAENLETLLNNTMVGFILIDHDYKVVSHNKTATKTYNELFNVKLKLESSFINILPDSIFPAFHQNFKKALMGKQVVTEEKIDAKTGGVRYFDFNYTPVKLSKKEREARMIAVSFVDITKRKNAELDLHNAIEDLQQEKQFMETLAESLPNMIWTTDSKGKLIYCNKFFLNYVGMSYVDIKKYDVKSFIHEHDWGKFNKLWKKTLQSKEILSAEYRIKNKDGEYRWNLTLISPIKNSKGDVYMWVGTSTDIHEQKMLDARKNEFISIASHELKTPVTSLKGYGQVLQMLLNGDTRKQDIIKKMDNQLNKLTDLINDLLDVSKIESGKLQLSLEKFSFDDLVDEVVEAVQFISPKHKIEKHGRADKEIFADKERVSQVITNLLTNAAKYSPNSNKIIAKTELKDGCIQFSVKDYGLGIPPDKQTKIFKRFYRVNGSDGITYPGLGLGLYISSEIINRLNGKIWFKSREKEGSTFYINLPLSVNKNQTKFTYGQ